MRTQRRQELFELEQVAMELEQRTKALQAQISEIETKAQQTLQAQQQSTAKMIKIGFVGISAMAIYVIAKGFFGNLFETK